MAQELETAYSAALQAGTILRRGWHDHDFTVSEKSRDNPVTIVDLEVDRKLREILYGGFPEYGWLSEETADDGARLAHDRVWIVDPLDGTKEFIRGVPEFAIAIALVERGVSVLGLTYNPIKGELFWGGRGLGCHQDGVCARVTTTTRLPDAKVLASRSETARADWKAYEGLVKLHAVGSVAYKLALVAAGRADVTFTRMPLSEWDVAAGAALIIAAGGRITDAKRCELRFNYSIVTVRGVIASNGRLSELERLIPPRKPEQ